MTEEEVQKMTWAELMHKLRTYENCCVDCQHMIVRNLRQYLDMNQGYMARLETNNKLVNGYFTQYATNEDKRQAKFRKTKLGNILLALQNPDNIYPVDTLPPPSFFSIYPLQE